MSESIQVIGSQNQEHLADLERKLAKDLTITDDTSKSLVTSSNTVLQLNDSPETEVDPGDVRELVTYESQTTVCQNNLDTEGNENLKLKEQVADLEKKLTSMKSMYMAKTVTLESITRVNMRTEKSEKSKISEDYKELHNKFIRTKASLEKQKSSLEECVSRLEKDLKKALSCNIELQKELELSRKSVVMLTDKLAESESALANGSHLNSILEQQVNAAKGEVEALSCQQLEVQRQCELKSKEIENLNSQLQLANQKQYNTDKKLNIMEKHILQKENAAHQIQNELKITKERLQKAEAAVDLMIEKYKVHENAIGQNSRLEKELQKANNNYNLSLQKVKHLKVKLAKRSKSFKDLQSKWSGLTTYFRTLEEKSAKGELLSRSDFDAVLNYLMSSNLLNGDITEQDNYPSDESVKHLRTSSDKNSDLNSISKSSKDFVSKDAIEKVVRDFREVAITKKSNLGGIAELCITKEDEVLVVKQKHSEPDVITIDSGSDSSTNSSLVKKSSCDLMKSSCRSLKNKRPYNKTALVCSNSLRSKSRTSPYSKCRVFKSSGRRPRSLSRSRKPESNRRFPSRSMSRDGSDVGSYSSCSRCSSPCSKSYRLPYNGARKWRRSPSPSCESYHRRSRSRSRKVTYSASHFPIHWKKYDRSLKSPVRKSYYRRRRSRSVSLVKMTSNREEKRCPKKITYARKKSNGMGKCRTSGGVIPYNESNVKKKQKKSLVSVVSENRKEMLEDILRQRLEDVEKEEGECSDLEIESDKNFSSPKETADDYCDHNDTTNVLLSPESSVAADISESEWDFLLMSPRKESPLDDVDTVVIKPPAVNSHKNKTSGKPNTIPREKSLSTVRSEESKKNNSNCLPSTCRPSEYPGLPTSTSSVFGVCSTQSATCYRSVPSRPVKQNSAITSSKIVRKKTRARKTPFERPCSLSATIPLEINVNSSGALGRDGILDSVMQKYTVSVTKEIPGYNDKHPIDHLNDVCNDKGWTLPEYQYEAETNTMKRELHYFCDVLVNGVLYQPKVGSRNKKDAQTLSAMYCLQQLGKVP